ncbi:sulfate permease [Hortaea werneckii]|nr:sulfate permease [Hortaea werneckii]
MFDWKSKFGKLPPDANDVAINDAAPIDEKLKEVGIESYFEDEPTISHYLREQVPGREEVIEYSKSLFPVIYWIGNYNLQWLAGDLVAGITVGAVVVPQGMAYAQLAELPVEYGLYTSFMGVLIYFFFATSKDITIGPVAVMSLLMGDIILKARDTNPEIPGHVIASAVSVIVGAIITFLGLFRLGWIVELISLSSVSAFVTGAAFTIACGQVSTMMGISGFSTRDGAYLSVIRTLRNLPNTSLDAALGLTALTMLYLIRSGFSWLAKHQPQRRKLWFFLTTLRTAFVILLYTLISWLMNLDLPNHDSAQSPIRILGDVPRGFQQAGRPQVNGTIISIFASELPAAAIVLLIEHISIAKSFGRVNGYTINPSQELVAIGVTNLLGPFLGAYPATGSFSRTAIKSKAGVRTPLAGVISAIVVLLAIYALPAVFFYIPNAALSAVIIHAVLDVLTPPQTLYYFWRTSPLDACIFIIGVFIIVFTSVEYGIYATVCLSAAVYLFRIFNARGEFLGPIRASAVSIDQSTFEQGDQLHKDSSELTLYLPVGDVNGSNPDILVQHPAPGYYIYRFTEGFCYLNASRYLDRMTDLILKETRPTTRSIIKKGDRQWNDTSASLPHPEDDRRPLLQAVILDFSSVNHLDVSSVQALIDAREQLGRHTAPEEVLWLFANVNNRWTRKTLLEAGFGTPNSGRENLLDLLNIAKLGDSLESGASSSSTSPEKLSQHPRPLDALNAQEMGDANVTQSNGQSEERKNLATDGLVTGLNRPCIYPNLTSAVQVAMQSRVRR